MVVLLVEREGGPAHGTDDGHLGRDDALLGAEALDLLDEVAAGLEPAGEPATGLQLLESGWHGPLLIRSA